MWSEQKSDPRGAAGCVTELPTTFLRPMWSFTVQTHGNMESVFFYAIKSQNIIDSDVINASVLQ